MMDSQRRNVCAHYVKMEPKMRNMYNDIRDNMFEMIVSNDDSFEDSHPRYAKICSEMTDFNVLKTDFNVLKTDFNLLKT